MNGWRNGCTHTLFVSLKHLLLPLPHHHVRAQSAQCGLDPSHSDSGRSPFEKLNRGLFGRVKWGPQKEKKNKLSSALLLQSQSQRRRLACWCNGRRRAGTALAKEESSSAQPHSFISPPSPWIKGTSDIINRGKRRATAKLKTRHRAGCPRGWDLHWVLLWLLRHSSWQVTEPHEE